MKGEIMGAYEDKAIDAVRDWLMELLRMREWCQARRVGKALEMLVEDRDRVTSAQEDRNRVTLAQAKQYEPRGERPR
jgi:hypothetical protein